MSECFLLCPNCKKIVKTNYAGDGSHEKLTCPKCSKQIPAQYCSQDGMPVFKAKASKDEEKELYLFIPSEYLKK